MIGIIAAEEKEMQEIRNVMTNTREKKYKNLTIHIGEISDKQCILVKAGVGKVNAARTTQLLIDKFKVTEIINLGAAGGLNENLKCGDIVIGKELVQHDFDITAFGHKKGYITDLGITFYSDKELIKKAYETMKKVDKDDNNVCIGNIATGDIFCTNKIEAKRIRQEFNSDCIEMEGAAIAQVCTLEAIPFIAIKSISDTPNGNNNIEYDEFLEAASKRCANFLVEFVK